MNNLISEDEVPKNNEFNQNTENDRGINHWEFPNNVLVIDNLFDHHFVSELEHWFMTEQTWKLDNTANRYSQPYGLEGFHKFLAITHFDMKLTFNPDYEEINNPLRTVYHSIQEHLGLHDSYLNSIQSNAMPYMCDGTWHVDVGGTYNKMFDRIVAVDQMYTIMFFSNSKWLPEWGGQFQYIDRKGETHSIDYVPGRVVIFPAVLKHRADAPRAKYIYRLSTVFRVINSIEWVYNNSDPQIHSK